MLWLTHGYLALGLGAAKSSLNLVFHYTAWPLYSLLYVLPAVVATCAARHFFPKKTTLVSLAGIVSSVLILLVIHTDSMIYNLYSFHINSFVLNLIFTPGGISSLGSGSESFISFLLLTCAVVFIQTVFMLLSLCLPGMHRFATLSASQMTGVALGLFLVQGSVYGISDVQNFGPVLDGSKVYPLFQRVRFRKLASQFGFDHQDRSEFVAKVETSILNYPLADIHYSDVKQPPNIIFLVAESLRWDQLNPQTMPNTWQISQRGLRFSNHYSSGNGTREGLFGMFYGLYGAYWENFMHARQSPLLMKRLQQLHYRMDIRTSASFTYPEFDKTLFANVSATDLHTADDLLSPWRRDQQNTDELIHFLDHHAATAGTGGQPFLEFFFFESTHAAYSFPEHSVITHDYQENVDYMNLSKEQLVTAITPLYNRYRNAAHWVDIQLGRIYGRLEQQGLLDNTIVIITGDHGEEFMEKGAWGHNSKFVEEQTHVPLVVLMPGQAPAVVERLTSHIDIATTLLQALGADTAAADTYTQGKNLLDTSGHDYIVISDWHSIGVMTPDMKYRIPYLTTAGSNYWAPTDQFDRPLTDIRAEELTTQYRQYLLAAMADCTQFSRRNTEARQ
jgi:membrane-anchored protein YejM (alkaline phosphatase superfamily)